MSAARPDSFLLAPAVTTAAELTARVAKLATDPDLMAGRPHLSTLHVIDECNVRGNVGRVGYVPRRIMYRNFWLFNPAKDFLFVDGKLMLRGQNASGKTSVLATTITLLLDGEKQAKYLDTFGDKERTLAYYLVGKEEEKGTDAYHDRRTGYAALEFQHAVTGRYITLLQGFTGRRLDGGTTSVEWWATVLYDRRVDAGHNPLILQPAGAREPLSRVDLIAALGAGVPVVDDTKAYQHAVNDALFGFSSLDTFRETMNLLRQLRSPKLNKDFKPLDVAAFLDNSLPSLGATVLAEATEIIGKIDDAERERQANELRLLAAKQLNDVQDQLARLLAQQSGLAFQMRFQEQRDAERTLAHAGMVKAEAAARVAELEAELRATVARRSEAETQAEALRFDPLLQSTQGQLRAAEDAVEKAKALVDDAGHEADKADARLASVRARAAEDTAAVATAVTTLGAQAKALRAAAAEAHWTFADRSVAQVDGVLAAARGAEDLRDLPAGVLEAAWPLREQHLAAVATALTARVRAQEDVNRLEEALLAAQRRSREANDASRSAVETLRSLSESLEGAVIDWRDSMASAGFPVSEGAIRTVTERIHQECESVAMGEGSAKDVFNAQRATQPVGAEMDGVRNQLADQEQDLVNTFGKTEALLAEVDRERRAMRQERDAMPPARPGRAAHRAALAAAGVRTVPLYLACNIREGVAPSDLAAVEAALLDAGLLDASIVLDRPAFQKARGALANLGGPSGSGDHWFHPAPPLVGPSLADVLEPAGSPADREAVLAALRSISIPKRDVSPSASSASVASAHVTPQGRWRLGPLSGQAPRPQQARPLYLGVENRRRTREALLAGLDARHAELTAERERLRLALSDARGRRKRLAMLLEVLTGIELWWDATAAARAVVAADKARAEAHVKRTAQEAHYHAALSRVSAASEALHMALEPVPELTEMDTVGVAAAKEAGWRVVMLTRSAQLVLVSLRTARAAATRGVGDVEQAEADASEWVARLDRARLDLGEREGRLAAAREAEQNDAVRDLNAQIAEAVRIAKASQAKERELIGQRGQAEKTSEYAALEADRAAADTTDRPERTAAALVEFRESLLRFRSPYYSALHDEASTSEESALRIVEQLLKARKLRGGELQNVITEELERTKHVNQTQFHAVKGTLAEVAPDLNFNGLVTFRQRSKTLTTAELVEDFAKTKEVHATILQEHQTTLFEQFILETLQVALRDQIREAKAFVERANAVMSTCSVPGGQRLSLRWTPRTISAGRPLGRDKRPIDGEALEDFVTGIDFGTIVKHLEHDASFEGPEATNEMRELFGAAITQVRAVVASRQTHKTLQQALEIVLDYRKWFQFRVMYQPAEKLPYRELTKAVFGHGSGAQRAMYVMLPLLAAVDAKLQGGRVSGTGNVDAPRLFGIDEAFAGIDSAHTAGLFRLMEELRFSWIMTSPSLWASSRLLKGSATYDFSKTGDLFGADLFVWEGTRQLSDSESWESGSASFMIPPGMLTEADLAPGRPTSATDMLEEEDDEVLSYSLELDPEVTRGRRGLARGVQPARGASQRARGKGVTSRGKGAKPGPRGRG